MEGAILPLVSCRKTNPKVCKFEQAIALVCRRIKEGDRRQPFWGPRVLGFARTGPCPNIGQPMSALRQVGCGR